MDQKLVSGQVREKVVELIMGTIDEMNRDEPSNPIGRSVETVLVGPKSALDSLRLVNFIVAVEQKVEEEFGFPISAIANEKAMSQKTSPLRSAGILADFISEIVVTQSR